MTYDWFHELMDEFKWAFDHCHSSPMPWNFWTISKQSKSGWIYIYLCNMPPSRCVYGQRSLVIICYITVIIVLARLLYFLKWIIFLRGREEKVARFLFPLVEVIVVSPAWTIVKQNFALQIATLNKDVPISSRGGGQIRTFQRCEDILSDEEDIKCGKASLQVGSRLLTYKRVPKWRWFRHTHHCHHHHIIISCSN